MSFYGFPEQSLLFLVALRENNTREWFEAHRGEYEKLILAPSRAFVQEMGEHLQALVPTIKAVPKVNGSLFRIYRDTRFSKDKTPLKTHIGFIFWQGHLKRMQSSGFYFHFAPDELFFAAGIHAFSQPMRDAYRSYIKDDNRRAELHTILASLLERGYHIPREHYKRYPRGFSKESPYAALSLLDGLYAYTTCGPEPFLHSQALIDEAYRHFEAMSDLQQWVYAMSQHAKETQP
jgi:uncharacterized protein (TIGR02453 family)